MRLQVGDTSACCGEAGGRLGGGSTKARARKEALKAQRAVTETRAGL